MKSGDMKIILRLAQLIITSYDFAKSLNPSPPTRVIL